MKCGQHGPGECPGLGLGQDSRVAHRLNKGARRVHTTFNPSGFDALSSIKQKAASLIDDIEDLRPQNEMDEVGDAVFFAATEPHAALPAKEGVRDSLTVWFSEGSGR